MRARPGILWLAVGALALACVTPPRPTPGALLLAANARATIEGRVRDPEGRAVEGIGVYAIPRGKDISWPPPAYTDAQGRFRLTVFAPAEYGFLLSWKGARVITTASEDPSRVRVAVRPGERREGVELTFLLAEWEKFTAGVAGGTSSFP